jgi:hypothetical protein
VQLDRRDRCLEFVGDGVDEVLVLLSTTPVMMRGKRMRPATSRPASLQLTMIQPMLRATAPPTPTQPRRMKMIDLRRTLHLMPSGYG